MQLKQAQETTQATKIAEHQHTLTFAQRGNARCDICRKSCGRGAYTYYCAGCDFDACQECVASRRPSSVTGAFRLNQRVKCKDSGDSSWKQGVVTSVSPLKVQCDGWADSFTWDQVERVDGTGGQQTTAQAPRTREPPPRRRLTTGDTVVICSGATKAGQRGTIIKDDGPSDDQPYKVQFTDGATHWYRAGEVASVAAEEKATKIAEHQHTLTFTQRTSPRCDICGKACGRGAYTYCCARCDFDACQECVASRRPSSISGQLRTGDRVRVKPSVSEPHYKWGDVKRSSVGTIKSIDGGDCRVNFPENSSWMGKVSEMERVDCSSGRLSTGDAVVICSGASRAGQRGTIIKDDGPSDNKPYKVQFRDGETGWYRAAQVSRELGRPTCGPKHNAVVRIANGSHRGGQLALIIEDDHSETPYKVRFKDSKTRWYKEAEVHWCSEPEMRSAPRADRADLVSLAKAVGGVAHFVGEGEINQAMGFVADAIKTGDIAVAAGRAGAGAVKGAIISTAAELVSEGLAEAGLTTAAAAVLGAEHGLILGPGGALLGAAAGAVAEGGGLAALGAAEVVAGGGVAALGAAETVVEAGAGLALAAEFVAEQVVEAAVLGAVGEMVAGAAATALCTIQ